MKLPRLNTRDFSYNLPEERIALYPLPNRDQAKILVWRGGKVSHKIFNQLPDLLPDHSILFFNDTRVIPARFFFEKETGASVEVLLLSPSLPSPLLSEALAATQNTRWRCAIGNLKRWTEGSVLKKVFGNTTLSVALVNRTEGMVEFSWTPANLSFGEVIQAAGVVPLPPYIKREAEASDRERYQTVYSHIEGAVAAPTAGLHFTVDVFHKIQSKDILTDFLTLHVSAGTFLPLKTENAMDHPMHDEQLIIHKRNLTNLLLLEKKVIAVGTTALRTLESVYWYGVLLMKDHDAPFAVDAHLPYQFKGTLPTAREAFQAVLSFMERTGREDLNGQTSIYIVPGYRFRVCQGLVTNFHQPGSTLLLLIAAFIGVGWKEMYREALEKKYRFLSYGDSSLLLPDNELIA